MKSDTAILVENVSKIYQLRKSRLDDDGVVSFEHWALKDVSFEIKKGESVGIIGPNGSGKSTLLKILAGVTKPTSGKVSIRGKVASILDIGAGFHPELSGRENVFLNGQIHGFSKKEIESKFEEIVGFSGIEKFIDEPVKNYSNGMYLRLAFSIMAHLDFDVYLFDEVLGVGDAEFKERSQHKIHQLQKANKTIISISHYLWEMADVEKIFYLKDGLIDAHSSKEEVIIKYSANKGVANLMINNPFFFNKNRTFALENFVSKLELRLKDAHGIAKTIFKSDEQISIEIDLTEVKEELNLGLVLLDQFNNPVVEISPMTQGMTLKKESFQNLKVDFPARFFNKNHFSIDLLLFNENEILFYKEKISSFAIINEDQLQNTIYENTWGSIRPFLNWTNKVITQ